MFVRVKTSPNSRRKSVQICESLRQGSTVRQRIVRHVGIAMDEDELERLKSLAECIKMKLEKENSQDLFLFSPEELQGEKKNHPENSEPQTTQTIDEVRLKDLVEDDRRVEGVQEVFGTLFDELGFNKILGTRENEVLKMTTIARVANPSSKYRASAFLEEDLGIQISVDRIYRMMDSLYDAREKIQPIVFEATRSLFPEKVDVVFFDITTLYFESFDPDELRAFGYSKDQKFHMTQVVLALATTTQGLPIGYKLFSGNTAEVTTLIQCLQEWRTQVPIDHALFVGDRALFSKNNLAALEEANLKYIVAAPMRKFKSEIKEKILDETNYQVTLMENDLYWVKEIQLEGSRRLVSSFSSRRAKKDNGDRQRLLDKLDKKLGTRPKQKKLISNQGYLKFTNTDDHAIASINWEKVDADSQWDGMHGVITNSDKNPYEVLKRYRQLWIIEESFRINKHDLKMRPIYHFTPQRIQSHVAICYLAYALARHTQYRVSLQKEQMSFQKIRAALLKVQSSILRDKKTGALYRLPSKLNPDARKIYQCFGLSRSLTPSAII